MPLSEHEQRVLQELEHALLEHDPAFAARVRSSSLHRHASLYLRWSVLGFLVGFAVMLALFPTNTVLGFVGVAIMFVSAVAFWTNLRALGNESWGDLSKRAEGISHALGETRTRLKGRFRHHGDN